MSTTRTIGHISEKGDKRGVLYTQVFFVEDTDKALYTPTYKQDGEVAPFNFQPNTYIYDWTIVGVSDHWLITVDACDDDFDWGGDESGMDGCIDQSMTKEGIKYQATYHVKPIDKITYLPEYGTDGDTAPWGFPEDTYIYGYDVKSTTTPVDGDEVDCECGVKSYNITVYACNNAYDWHTGANRVGEVSSYTDKRGTKYTATYFIANASKTTYTPTLNQDGAVEPFNLPAGSYIYGWKFEPVYTNPAPETNIGGYTDVTLHTPAHWTLTVDACNNDYNWGDDAGEGDDENRVLQSFGVTQIYFPIEWFGICHWKNHAWYALVQADLKDNTLEPSLKTVPPKLALDSNLTAQGPDDLVFINAKGEVPAGRDNPSAPDPGSAVPSETAQKIWYNASALTNHLDWAGTNVTTVSYTVKYYRSGTKTPTSYISWAGVNGGFTPPTGCVPTGYTSTGTWRSVKQYVVPNKRKFNNAWYTYVERVMEKAPEDLLFKAGGPNGPIWDW